MRKRKILSILALILAFILVIMTSVPIYYGGEEMQWTILFGSDVIPFAIFGIGLMVAAFVLGICSFIKKNRAKLFITLSVIATWLSGTIMAIGTLLKTEYGIIPLICYFVLCAPVLLWNLILKNKSDVNVAQPESTVENNVIDNVLIPTVGQPAIIESASGATSVNESSASSKSTVDIFEQPNNAVHIQEIKRSEDMDTEPQPELTAEKVAAETVTISATNQPEIIERSTVGTNESSVSGQSFAKTADQQAKTVLRTEITDSEGDYSEDGKTLLKINGHCSIFTVPDGVTTIARNAMLLHDDTLREVVIPSSVKNIGLAVFPHNLKAIYFKGTKADWKNIKIDDKINVRIYYYNENSPSKSDDCWRYASDGITPEITNISILSMLGF